MRPYPVEGLLVTRSIMEQAFPEPVTELDRAMPAHNCISLFSQYPLDLRIHGETLRRGGI